VASFVVETFVPPDDPDGFAADVRNLRAAARAVTRSAAPVRHVRSYLVPEDAMGFHVLDAATAEDVARVTADAKVEAERIVATVSIPPETA
jgi:hypothetical protein